MSKEQTTIFKGIAILMMLAFHLFVGADIEEWCTPWVYVGDKPLVGMLARACYPVTFFLIFTGYGLSYLFDRGRLTFATQIRRLLRLYIFYWVGRPLHLQRRGLVSLPLYADLPLITLAPAWCDG